MNANRKARPTAVLLLALALFGAAAALQSARGPSAAARSRQDGQDVNIHRDDPRGKVAFASDLEENFEIYVLNPEGGGLARVTSDPAEDFDPTFSPDGERVAFVSDRDGNQNIYVVSVDGGTATRLTSDAAEDLDPAWSPDGSKIAFTSERDGNQNVYVMNADGSGQTRLTDSTGKDFRPSWSPTGARLAFASDRDGNEEVYAMNADGSGQTNLTNNAAGDDLNPAWSPMRITFQSTRDGNDEIYSMNADGSNQTRLTNNPEFDGRPARAMDGSLIVFVSARDGNFELYAMNADGSSPRRLTASEENDLDPDLQPLATTAPASTVQFSAATFSGAESAGSIPVTVTRTGDVTGPAVVDLSTVSGTASERSDFTAAYVTLRFAPGETSKTVNVLVVNDALVERDETFAVTLASPTGALLGATNSATVTILDDDTTQSAANPIDEAQFFVRQQYLDFLSREADAAGLAFWTNQLNMRVAACPASPANVRAQCVLGARAAVSTAFFLSIEFQGTGYFVIRVYQEAFGRLPTLREFLSDTQAVNEGVIIGQPGALERLAANRRAFLDNFVNRAGFRERYETTSNGAYVNALFTNAGVNPSAEAATRDALVAGLNDGTQTRATALAAVSETRSVFNAVYNPAFILMEYFGYLRRNPQDAPNTDLSGFNFWLNKINSFSQPGEDVRDARVAFARIQRSQIVEAFVDSTEYRARFGQP